MMIKEAKKVVFVCHCIFNQNTKLDACAHYPGTIKETAEVLFGADVGIIQIPCPEFLYLGLDRQVEQGKHHSVESEDTWIASRMEEADARNLCKNIIADIVYQMIQYHKNGFEVIGLIGINGSPTCGVETTWYEGAEHEGPGIFIKMFTEECKKNNISLKMIGIKAKDPQEAISKTKKLLKVKL